MNSSIIRMLHLRSNLPRSPQILEQKTIFHTDYECSMQESLEANVLIDTVYLNSSSLTHHIFK